MINEVIGYKDLLELIDINEKILANCKESHRQIEMFLLKQGRPAGYPTGTSYLDADCIHSSRKELHPDTLQKLVDEFQRLDNMIFLQEEILKGLYKTKKEIDEQLKKLKGIELQVVIKRMLEGKTQEQTAAELNYSVRQLQRIESKVRGGINEVSEMQ